MRDLHFYSYHNITLTKRFISGSPFAHVKGVPLRRGTAPQPLTVLNLEAVKNLTLFMLTKFKNGNKTKLSPQLTVQEIKLDAIT